MDPQPTHVRHRLQSRDKPRQTVVIEQEWVATGEDHLVDRRVRRERIQGCLDAGLRRTALGVGKLASKAVAAVDRAAASRQQQRAAGILLHEAG